MDHSAILRNPKSFVDEESIMSLIKTISQNRVFGKLFGGIISKKVNSEVETISTHFEQFLEARIANSASERDIVHNIRHKVYCEELGFEPTKANEKEADKYDGHSWFGTIAHRPTNETTGCVRVVAPKYEHQRLPIEDFCSNAYSKSRVKPSDFPRNEICEISRLAVLPQFRRRRADNFPGAPIARINTHTFSMEEMRCFPFISIGLYLTAACIGVNIGCKHCFVMMEPRLSRSMALVGIKFEQIGKPVEYHGMRAPYYINGEMFLNNLSPGFLSLYRSIAESTLSQIESIGTDRSEFVQKAI